MSKHLVTAIGLVLSLGVIALGVFLVAMPLYFQAVSVIGETAAVAQTNAIYQAQVDSLREQEENLDQINASVAGLRSQIPATGQLDDVFEVVGRAAEASGVAITAVTAGEQVAFTTRTSAAEGDAAAVAPAPTPEPTPTDAATDVSATPPTAPSGSVGATGRQQVDFEIRATADDMAAGDGIPRRTSLGPAPAEQRLSDRDGGRRGNRRHSDLGTDLPGRGRMTDMDHVDFETLLARGARYRASDVHITAEAVPLMRVDGDLVPIPGYPDVLSEAWVEKTAFDLMTDGQRREFEEHGEVDLAHATPGIGRFRTNVFRQLGSIAIALRFIPDRVYSLEELGAPAIARDLALRPRGLVLLTGPTGSGKSTTLTAMVDIVNQLVPAHIITIEDPIEFHHESKRALIHQREVGRDTNSFAEALRRVLRQDPDVILIGELRDPESISTALSAAETGHLVLSTLHTQGAAKSINRIIDVFPADQQHQIRTQLGDTLQGVISQTLMPLSQTNGRTIATEVLINTPAVANMIREGQVAQLYSAMQAGAAVGMHTLDQDLRRLVSEGTIALNVARDFASDPKSLDGVHVRPRDLDAEEWAHHAGEWRQADPASVAPANTAAGTGIGMGSLFGTPTVGGRVDPTAREVSWSDEDDIDADWAASRGEG